MCCQVKSLDTSRLDPSFLAYHGEAVAADIKEGLCRTNDNVFVPGDNKQMPSITYEVRHCSVACRPQLHAFLSVRHVQKPRCQSAVLWPGICLLEMLAEVEKVAWVSTAGCLLV
jgi:hypothetical protein